MPMNIFGNSSAFSEDCTDSSLFVQKPYLRTNFIEADIEEDFDMKSQFTFKNSKYPISITNACSKSYVENKFIDRSRIKNTARVDFNDKSLNNVRFIKVNSFPSIPEHLTAKIYVDQAISDGVDESSFLRLDLDEKLKSDEQHYIVPDSTLTSPQTIIELSTKAYVDSLHENSRKRRDLSTVFNDQDNESDIDK